MESDIDTDIKIGKEFKDFEKNGVLEAIEAWILVPLENEAFNEFGKITPTDSNAIMEVQIKQKAVELFRISWMNLVYKGQLAQEELELNGNLEGSQNY